MVGSLSYGLCTCLSSRLATLSMPASAKKRGDRFVWIQRLPGSCFASCGRFWAVWIHPPQKTKLQEIPNIWENIIFGKIKHAHLYIHKLFTWVHSGALIYLKEIVWKSSAGLNLQAHSPWPLAAAVRPASRRTLSAWRTAEVAVEKT